MSLIKQLCKLFSAGMDKEYVSEADKKLAEFDQTHSPSPSQQQEIKKHKNIFNRKKESPIQW